MPAWAQGHATHQMKGGAPIRVGFDQISGDVIDLTVGHGPRTVQGRKGLGVAVNGSVPGPLIRLKEGQNVRLNVTNQLAEDTSIHWHGLLLPFHMDGVPGISFPGIKPGQTFTYEFPIRQSGTYWYHSHSGLQEQLGHYGPIVIDPAGADPVAYDREHVVVLSDHSELSPEAIFRKMKVNPGHFNMQRQTLSGLLAGKDQSLKERAEWGAMRMDPTDIADVNGSTYQFLVNGYGPRDNWTALFNPGERVRLRIVNASAMTIFNIRIPGLRMTVVQADGLNVRPVTVDEFQIGTAETYDVVVTPQDRAYSFVSEASDRSGLGRATLAPREGMSAPVPPLRPRPLLTMKDMGMGDMAAPGADASTADHAAMGHAMPGMDHGSMKMRDPAVAPQVKMGPGVATLSPMPMDRTGERPTGLEKVGHRVLTYRDLAITIAAKARHDDAVERALRDNVRLRNSVPVEQCP